jgi:hypothetical protein
MKDQPKTRYLLSICLLSGVCLLAACSYLTNFIVINTTDRPIEVQYVIKKPVPPFPPFPPSQAIHITPAIKDVSHLQKQTEWRELETEKKQGRCESDPAFLLMAAVRIAGCFGYSNPWVWKT